MKKASKKKDKVSPVPPKFGDCVPFQGGDWDAEYEGQPLSQPWDHELYGENSAEGFIY